MLVDADLSQLEWRVAAELSQDPIMIQEILEGCDIHTANSIAIFGTDKFRQESKVISFRSLYGGTPYAFYMDTNMPNFSLKKWEKIADTFNSKYKGLIAWQDKNYATVIKTGQLTSFTGRIYKFFCNNKGNTKSYSRPSVCNYPVQGCATGDLVPLAMTQIYRAIKRNKWDEVKIINQVHDSIVLDSPTKYVEELAKICIDTFERLPESIYKYWGYKWGVPLTGEVKCGYNWSDMKKVK